MTTHTTASFTSHRKRLALLMSLGLLIISAIVIRQVIAQDSESGKLKPPFHLIRSDQLGPSNGVPPLPLDAPIIISETFDSNFAPLPTIAGDGWHTTNFDGVLQGYSWGRVFSSGLMTDTVWNAGTRFPTTLPELRPGTPYTNNQQSLLIYGPLDLSDYGAAVMTATYYSDVQPGDFFGAAVSTDGTNFIAVSSESSRDPSLSVERIAFYNLTAYARQPHVWIAFYFTSNNDDLVALGTFIDEMILRGEPLHKTHLPYLVLQIPSPTPTPTRTPTPTNTPTPTATPPANYRYNYTFGDGSSTNADFITWGKKRTNLDCYPSDCLWGQDIVTSGNPGGAMAFYQTGLNSIAAASPDVSDQANYELSADIFVIQGKTDARYGLIFSASNNAFGRDNDGVPFFDPNRNLYKFDLQFNESDNTVVSYYRLQHCTVDITACDNIFPKSTLPSGVVRDVGNWNTITIQRYGTTGNIKVWVNNHLLIDYQNDNDINTGAKKFGIFLQTKDFNSSGNPLRIRFDNVKWRPLP